MASARQCLGGADTQFDCNDIQHSWSQYRQLDNSSQGILEGSVCCIHAILLVQYQPAILVQHTPVIANNSVYTTLSLPSSNQKHPTSSSKPTTCLQHNHTSLKFVCPLIPQTPPPLCPRPIHAHAARQHKDMEKTEVKCSYNVQTCVIACDGGIFMKDR